MRGTYLVSLCSELPLFALTWNVGGHTVTTGVFGRAFTLRSFKKVEHFRGCRAASFAEVCMPHQTFVVLEGRNLSMVRIVKTIWLTLPITEIHPEVIDASDDLRRAFCAARIVKAETARQPCP